eukprot:365745-Chlamydomonas_euryale.AAC.4
MGLCASNTYEQSMESKCGSPRGGTPTVGVIPLERSGHVGQPGKVWTSLPWGPIGQSSPPTLLHSLRCVGQAGRRCGNRVAAGGQVWCCTKTRQFVWIAPTRHVGTRNGIITYIAMQHNPLPHLHTCVEMRAPSSVYSRLSAARSAAYSSWRVGSKCATGWDRCGTGQVWDGTGVGRVRNEALA